MLSSAPTGRRPSWIARLIRRLREIVGDDVPVDPGRRETRSGPRRRRARSNHHGDPDSVDSAKLVLMATVRAMMRFDESIGVDLDLLGTTFVIASDLGPITMEFPGFDWVSNHVWARPPSGAAALVESGLCNGLFDALAGPEWGESWRSNASEGTGAMHVAALIASVEIDDERIERSGYLHGIGSPIGAAIADLRRSIGEWRSRFVRWAALISGQPVDPDLPPIGSRVVDIGSGIVVWVQDAAEIVGVPSYQSAAVTLTMPSEHEVVGFIMDQAMFNRVLKLASTAEQPTAQLLLLGRARAAIQRDEFRVAMIELGSAAELCLWNTFRSTGRVPTPKQLRGWTLGTLVNELYQESDPRFCAALTSGIVDPRNDAIHRALDSARSTTLDAFTLVRQMVSDELPEPLPSTVGDD